MGSRRTGVVQRAWASPGAAAMASGVAALGTVAMILPSPARAQNDWLDAPSQQQRLSAGEVVVRSTLEPQQARVSVDAAIRVHAAPQSIWNLITRCESAAVFIPGLKRCEQLQTAPDGSWAVIEHDIKYSALLPMIHSIFRADFVPPYRMDFHRIGGDLKDESGAWILKPSADGTSTTVEYRITMQPGFWVPHGMVRHSLKKQLPAALVALRAHAEQPSAAALVSALPGAPLPAQP